MSGNTSHKLRWIGAQDPHLDDPWLHAAGDVTLGIYGGNTASGAHKNEDGALCWSDPHHGWEWAMVLDGHNGSESVQLLVDTMETDQQTITGILNEPVAIAIPHLQQRTLDLLSSIETSHVRGETACLLVARKDDYVWWLSIGDCVLYVLHPEYAKFGQFAANQRHFFEWSGQVNTFRDEVPCYTSGTKRLRRGKNAILAVTDGVLECGTRPFEKPVSLYAIAHASADTRSCVVEILRAVQAERGTDSATIVAWSHVCEGTAPYPSNWHGTEVASEGELSPA